MYTLTIKSSIKVYECTPQIKKEKENKETKALAESILAIKKAEYVQ